MSKPLSRRSIRKSSNKSSSGRHSSNGPSAKQPSASRKSARAAAGSAGSGKRPQTTLRVQEAARSSAVRGNGKGANTRTAASVRGHGRSADSGASTSGRVPHPELPPIQAAGRKQGEWYIVKLPQGISQDAAPAQLLKRLPIPAKIADKLLREKAVTKQRDRLIIRLFPEEQPEFVAQWTDLNIVYEDEFTLVVNKPAGLEIYPSADGQTGTLANHVAAYYETTGQACRVRHIHRLDKDTTGPVLYAKNELAHYVYDRDMREKKIERIYVAVVEGLLENDNGVIDLPIGKDRHHSTRRRVSQTGERAVTRYEVIERFDDHTLVRLRLETGRTHQIRVHMSAIGHPLAGDGMYGGKRTLISRQALHGEQLLFNHAWTGKRIGVQAPWPDDFQQLVRQLRMI